MILASISTESLLAKQLDSFAVPLCSPNPTPYGDSPQPSILSSSALPNSRHGLTPSLYVPPTLSSPQLHLQSPDPILYPTPLHSDHHTPPCSPPSLVLQTSLSVLPLASSTILSLLLPPLFFLYWSLTFCSLLNFLSHLLPCLTPRPLPPLYRSPTDRVLKCFSLLSHSPSDYSLVTAPAFHPFYTQLNPSILESAHSSRPHLQFLIHTPPLAL